MIKKYFTLTFLIFTMFSVQGQQDLTIYHMPSIQQMHYVNISKRPDNGVNIGLPGISSIYFRQQNTFLNPSILFENNGNTVDFKSEDFLNNIGKKNILGADFAVDLFSFGMGFGDNYMSFSVREKATAKITLPEDLLAFPFTGNANFERLDNGTLDFSDLDIRLNHYREYGLSFQRKLNDKWEVGGRLKYLYGLENVTMKRNDIQWKTDETTWDYEITGQLDINSSGFGPLLTDENEYYDLEDGPVSEYLFKRKNRGFGIDLGATRQIGDRLEVSANVIDLGYIKWKTYNKNLVSNSGQFLYDGIYVHDGALYADSAFTDSVDVIMDDLWESFKDEFETTDNEDSYTSLLSTRLSVSALYDLYEGERSSATLGGLLQTEIYRGNFYPTLTLSYNQRFQRWLSASASYSIIDWDFRNLGLGLSANAGPVQIYVVADNLLAANRTRMQFGSDSDDSFTYPSYSKNVHVHAGVNINLFRPKKDRDKDGVEDKKDKCPGIPGESRFDGCPDTDGDGVQDSEDQCPTVKGKKKFDGCPDSDDDGIQDSQDDCPSKRGPKETNGCPDRDGDGIIDSEDDCPKEKGLKQFNGCPDSDGDGIQDSKDECPNKKGSINFNGCPDSDEDGIMDKEDDCPNKKGPKDNNGCPYNDRDGDGLLDKDDDCPGTFGPAANNGCPFDDFDQDGVLDPEDLCPKTPGLPENQGCPMIEKEEQEILNTAFENLEFVTGKNEIKQASYESLDRLAELMEKKDNWKIRISGHTDNVGNDESNLNLSKNRANAVSEYLQSRGVRLDRIFVKWFGETEPIASNDTEEGRQKNRRVEMEIVFE